MNDTNNANAIFTHAFDNASLSITNITVPASPVVVGGLSDTRSIFANDAAGATGVGDPGGSRTITVNDYKYATFDLMPGTYTLQASIDITGQASGNAGAASVNVELPERRRERQHVRPRWIGNGAFSGPCRQPALARTVEPLCRRLRPAPLNLA